MTAFLLEWGRQFCGNQPVRTSLPYDEKQPLLSFVARLFWQYLRRCLAGAAMFAPAAEILSKNRATESIPLKRDEIETLAQHHALLAIAAMRLENRHVSHFDRTVAAR
jgi:hypothetical protein